MPSFMSKVTGFTIGMARWIAAGRPRRNPAWVAELFAQHCGKPCGFFDPDGSTEFGDLGICTKCGCHVSPTAETIRNKLVLPTEGCPEGFFDASVVIERDNNEHS